MGLMRKLTAAVAAASLMVSLVGTALAADLTPAGGKVAGEKMIALGLLTGRPGDDKLALNETITRAELMTIMVRAYGQEANAKLLAGAPVFTDSAKHWASGYIAMAKAVIVDQNKMEMGLPDGSFAPDEKVTPAQAIAFLMKFLGIQRDTTKSWPNDYLDKAVAAGLITADDKAAVTPTLNANATRGFIFALFDGAFSTYKFADGKTFYTKFVDTTAPVLTVTKPAATTMEDKVTVSGTVKGAVSLKVAGTAVALTGESFTATVNLPELKEYTIPVEAMDLAGNVASDSFKVTRSVGTATALEAKDITVAAGATVDVATAVKDAKGNVITGVAVTGESAVGTFADGKFTAGTKAGAGTLKLTAGELTTTVNVTVTAGALAKVVAAAETVQPGKTTTVVAKDANDNVITGVTFTQSSADALLDATTGTFIATKAGAYTVKATKDGVTVEGTVNVFGDIEKLVIVPPTTIVANNSSKYEILVKAVDEAGNLVSTFEDDIELSVDAAFAADFTFTNATVEAKDGVAKFEVKAQPTVGNQEMKFIARYDNNDSGGITAADKAHTAYVSIQSQVASTIKVEAPDWLPTNVRANGQDVTVKILDQAGKEMVEGSWEVNVVLTGPASLKSDEDDKDGTKTITYYSDATPDVKTFTVYPNDRGDAGDVTVAVSFTGMAAGQDTMKAAFAQGAKGLTVSASKTSVQVDDVDSDDSHYIEYTVKVVDKNGVPVTDTTADYTAKISFADVADEEEAFLRKYDDTATLIAAHTIDGLVSTGTANDTDSKLLAIVDGVGKFRVYGTVVDTFTVKVADNDAELTAAADQTANFTVEDAAIFGFTKSALNVLRKDSTTATVSVQLFDEFGNKVSKSGVTFTFKDSTGDYDGVKINGKEDDVEVDTDANGVATATVTLASFVNSATIVATEDEDDIAIGAGTEMNAGTYAYVNQAITATSVAPASLSLEFVTDDTDAAPRLSSYQIDTNAALYLKVTVKDNYGRAMTNVQNDYGFKVTDSNADWSAGTITWTESATDGIYYSSAISPEVAENLTLTVATKKMETAISASRTIAVYAGNVENVEIVEAKDDAIDVNDPETKELTLRLVDKFGNVVSTSKVTQTYKVYLQVTGAGNDVRNTDGKSQTVFSIANGRNTAKFKFFAAVETGTVTATLFVDADADGAYDVGELVPTNDAAHNNNVPPVYTVK